jgi:hypothetical protein
MSAGLCAYFPHKSCSRCSADPSRPRAYYYTNGNTCASGSAFADNARKFHANARSSAFFRYCFICDNFGSFPQILYACACSRFRNYSALKIKNPPGATPPGGFLLPKTALWMRYFIQPLL